MARRTRPAAMFGEADSPLWSGTPQTVTERPYRPQERPTATQPPLLPDMAPPRLTFGSTDPRYIRMTAAALVAAAAAAERAIVDYGRRGPAALVETHRADLSAIRAEQARRR